MSDYFDDIEQQLRGAVRTKAHLPWYVRLRLRHSRMVIGALVCLVIGGPAIAYAAGAFQNGTPVGPYVPPLPGAFEGKAVPSSVHLSSLRVPDPAGGPPWVLRAVKTTRGLECLQLGRYANGGIGVLGEDGAFDNDGRFHPLSPNLFEFIFSCGALDGAGHAFINEVDYGLPASALATGNTSSGGCYAIPVTLRGRAQPVCPAADERDVYFGLLGPDAVSVTYRTASGGTATELTTGPDGAYLIVLRFAPSENARRGVRAGGETGGPTLEDIGASTPILTATYTRGRACTIAAHFINRAQDAAALRKAIYTRFPALAKAARSHHGGQIAAIIRSAAYHRFLRAHAYLIPGSKYADPTCQAVGYVAPKLRLITSADVKTPISARIEVANSYCVSPTEVAQPCGATTPAGFRRVPAQVARTNANLVVTWKTRVAVTNQDSHYEVYNSDTGTSTKGCANGGTSFGPTESNLSVGQKVVFTTWMPLKCAGVTHGTVVFVQDNGPAGSIPVPAQPGEGPDIPVGKFSVNVP
jgi:hypothetical protein